MKLKPYLAIILAVTAFTAKAQKADTAQIIVHYKFTHVRDTLNRDKPLVENMMLLAGRNASVYKSYDRKLREEQMRKMVMEQVNTGSANINVRSGGSPLGPNIDYYQYPNANKFYSRERLVNNYVIEEALPAPVWKISADTATINGLQCQKAATHFKGRDYTAWFCADLPYRVGPWKLNGLPGLIVEAYDAKKEVEFKFDGLEKVDPKAKKETNPIASSATSARTIIFGGADDRNQAPNVIALPANAIKTTPKELNELKEVMRKDPEAFFQSQLAAMPGNRSFTFSGGTNSASGIKSVNVQRNDDAKINVTNNPIELPENGNKK
ncbi:GLPGLI family protein [Mucilaginibacter aquatilis]|uniref:GLPGLI family protein n=1 Tax=Mucilaginibacter aquatilis TaxID=1517760 RepID=A0A6I4I335_9SPHI|nr:GLPGLI family protein [Mucilaginibacter aquatilis]MVN89555.1 GLPGLI family protein [Mucilaginibacter aquatilis]